MGDPRDGFEIVREFTQDDFYFGPDNETYFSDGVWSRSLNYIEGEGFDTTHAYTASDLFGPWEQRGEFPGEGHSAFRKVHDAWLVYASARWWYSTDLETWQQIAYDGFATPRARPPIWDDQSGQWWTWIEISTGVAALATASSITDTFDVHTLVTLPVIDEPGDKFLPLFYGGDDSGQTKVGRKGSTYFTVYLSSNQNETYTASYVDIILAETDDLMGEWTPTVLQRYGAYGNTHYLNENYLLPEALGDVIYPVLPNAIALEAFDWLHWDDDEWVVIRDGDLWRSTEMDGTWEFYEGPFYYVQGDGLWLRRNQTTEGDPDIRVGTSPSSLEPVDFEATNPLYPYVTYHGDGAWLGYWYSENEDATEWTDHYLEPPDGSGGWGVTLA